MLKSLFSLIKSSKGKFKSEKQAKFLLSRCDGNVYSETQNLHFGEYEQRSRKNTAQVTWTFTLSDQGVELVEKFTNKQGVTVYWANTQEYHIAHDEKEQIKRAEHLEYLNSVMHTSFEEIDSLYGDWCQLNLPETKDALLGNTSLNLGEGGYKKLLRNHKEKLNSWMNQYQSWAIDAKIASRADDLDYAPLVWSF